MASDAHSAGMAHGRGRERDETTGRHTEEFPPERFIDALADPGGSADTRTLTDRVGCSRRLTSLRCNRLADAGRVDRQQVGNSILWVLADE